MKSTFLKNSKIPNNPGVYFFTKGKEIVYIGKATSLRSRVKSYFSKDLIGTRGPLLVDMMFHADDIKWQVTDSVLEALILEASLIKKHQPKYNTKEKDDKSWNYVLITKEKLPKVIVVRGKDLPQEYKNLARLTLPRLRGGTYTVQNFHIPASVVFGPFTNGRQLIEALKIVRRIFPFLDDKSKNYNEFYRQINLVPDLNDRKLYLQNIKNIKLFFQGKKKRIIFNLKKEMALYAKRREFEKAGETKRQLFALQHINDVALLKNENSYHSQDTFRIEAYDIAHMSGKNMVGVMTVVENNSVNKNEYRKFKIRTQEDANDTGALAEVLKRRLAHTEWRYPNLIVLDGGVAQINAAEKVLKDLEIEIQVVSVVKDKRHKPRAINGRGDLALDHKDSILLGNSEAHRFAIAFHKNRRAKAFLK